MRLFAAIDPPTDALSDLQASVRHKGTGIRWAPPAQWHITTAFYGEVGAATLDELVEQLAAYASRSRPMSLQIKGAGCFPRRPDAARVLWAGVAGDLDELAQLATRCVTAGRRSEIAMQRRTFVPHLTLARTREPTDFSGRLAELWHYAGPGWTASSLRLVRSALGDEARHETIAEWPLVGGADNSGPG